jgi:hypothetical protein
MSIEPESRIIGRDPFVDGAHRDVYEDPDERQWVFGWAQSRTSVTAGPLSSARDGPGLSGSQGAESLEQCAIISTDANQFVRDNRHRDLRAY